MYPNRAPGAGHLADGVPSVQALARALPGVPWVVDLAHVGLWARETRAASLALLRELPLLEMHLSDNDSVHDSHTAITAQTWWLGAERSFAPGAPRVLETRMLRRTAPSLRRELLRVSELRERWPPPQELRARSEGGVSPERPRVPVHHTGAPGCALRGRG
jgi:hypothetical protein